MNPKSITETSITQLDSNLRRLEGDVATMQALDKAAERLQYKMNRSDNPGAALYRFGKLCHNRELFQRLYESVCKQIESVSGEMDTVRIMLKAAGSLKSFMHSAFPGIMDNPVALAALDNLSVKKVDKYTLFRLEVAELIFRCWFSVGPLKAYDKYDPNYFDPEMLNEVQRKGLMMNEAWFDQFIRCLADEDQEDNVALMDMTPVSQRKSCERIFITLYMNTEQN